MTTTELRKKPKQARSLARFNAILDVAEAMIAEQGNTDIVMNELARQAEVNIASIYQYFPNRQALLRQLIERYLEKYREYLQQTLMAYKGSGAGLVDLIVDGYAGFFSQAPVFAALWSEAQGDPALKALDILDSEENARFISAVMQHHFPAVAKQRAEMICFMLCDLSGGLMQTALCLDEQKAARLIKEYKVMLHAYLTDLE